MGRPTAPSGSCIRAQWDADAARDELIAFVVETLGDPEGIGVVDETGFLKKCTRSVGVKRQYTGMAGKAENCGNHPPE
jgi:SRSO17 transposase